MIRSRRLSSSIGRTSGNDQESANIEAFGARRTCNTRAGTCHLTPLIDVINGRKALDCWAGERADGEQERWSPLSKPKVASTLSYEIPNVNAIQDLCLSEQRDAFVDPSMQRAVRLVCCRELIALSASRACPLYASR